MVEFKEKFIDCFNGVNNRVSKFITEIKEPRHKDFFCFVSNLQSDVQRLKLNIDTKCLVLAQYAGAEIKGLGGLISQNPKNFEILCFTNGSSLIENKDKIDSSAIIKQKFYDTMKKARVKGYKIFDIEDKTLKDNYPIFRKIDISEADFIFVPNLYDSNPDTLALLRHLKRVLSSKEHKGTLKIFMYESDYSLSTVDYYVDITSIIETKKNIIKEYYPEELYPDLAQKITGLNAFRSIGRGADYCETFMSYSVESFLRIPVI